MEISLQSIPRSGIVLDARARSDERVLYRLPGIVNPELRDPLDLDTDGYSLPERSVPT